VKPVRVYLHERVRDEAGEALADAGLDRVKDRALHWLGSLAWRCTRKVKAGDTRWVAVNARIGRVGFHDKADYARMIDAFKAAGIIDIDPIYHPGVHSRRYRIKPSLVSSRLVCHEIYGRTADSIRAARNRAKAARRERRKLRCPQAVYDAMVATLRTVGIDRAVMRRVQGISRRRAMRGETVDASYSNQIENVSEMRSEVLMPNAVLLHEDRQGRVYSPITNLKGYFRKYLHIEGERLCGIDIKNSQPFFAVRLLERIAESLEGAIAEPTEEAALARVLAARRHMSEALRMGRDDSMVLQRYLTSRLKAWSVGRAVQVRAELDRFKASVVSGGLYEQVAEAMGRDRGRSRASPWDDGGCKPPTRKLAKRQLLIAWFNLPEDAEKAPAWAAFSSIYPLIAFEINALKSIAYQSQRKGYKVFGVFARLLQMVESKHVFEACRGLVEARIWFFTIHDSFVVRVSQQEQAKAIIEAMFKGWNMSPSLKVESYEDCERTRLKSKKSEISSSISFILETEGVRDMFSWLINEMEG
jgi:hypothetical protein